MLVQAVACSCLTIVAYMQPFRDRPGGISPSEYCFEGMAPLLLKAPVLGLLALAGATLFRLVALRWRQHERRRLMNVTLALLPALVAASFMALVFLQNPTAFAGARPGG